MAGNSSTDSIPAPTRGAAMSVRIRPVRTPISAMATTMGNAVAAYSANGSRSAFRRTSR